jgi:hypothetical protein
MVSLYSMKPRRPIEARISSKNCASESMTHHLSKTEPCFDVLVSADKLQVHLLAEYAGFLIEVSECGIGIETCMSARETQLKQNRVLCQRYLELISMVLHQANSEFWCDKGNQRVFRISFHHLLLPAYEKLVFPIADLRIREGSRPVGINQFASDFDIAQPISDSNLEEDSLFHFDFHIPKADKNEENR